MKRFIFVMPLIAISLFSCGNKEDTKVNADELRKALLMEGVEYLQVQINRDDGVNIYEEFAPHRHHHINENPIQPYLEEFFVETEDKVEVWKRENKDDPLTPITYEGEIETIQKFIEVALSPIIDKTYEDFVYQEATKEYFISWVSLDGDNNMSAIKFSNKKVVEFTSWNKDVGREKNMHITKFGYKHIIPDPQL